MGWGRRGSGGVGAVVYTVAVQLCVVAAAAKSVGGSWWKWLLPHVNLALARAARAEARLH